MRDESDLEYELSTAPAGATNFRDAFTEVFRENCGLRAKIGSGRALMRAARDYIHSELCNAFYCKRICRTLTAELIKK